jgi:hypothetical protein
VNARDHILTSSGAFRWWVALATSLVGVAGAMILTIGYVQKIDRVADQRNVERQRQICGIVRIIDDRNQELPPATDVDTADFRAELHRYRVSLGC